jgi:hypothetical protein
MCFCNVSVAIGTACLVQQPVCLASEYELAPATASSLRTCFPLRTCHNSSEFEILAPTRTSDRICLSLAACVLGSTYQVTRPTATTNRVCAPVSQCQAGEGVARAPTLETNALCAPCANQTFQNASAHLLPCTSLSRCGNRTVALEATATTDRQCAECQPGSRLEHPDCVPCAPGSYSLAANAPECTLCEAGHAQPNSSATSCPACRPGLFQHMEGQAVCLGCPPGHQCPSGSIDPAPCNGSRFELCLAGASSSATCACVPGNSLGCNASTGECKCRPGFTGASCSSRSSSSSSSSGVPIMAGAAAAASVVLLVTVLLLLLLVRRRQQRRGTEALHQAPPFLHGSLKGAGYKAAAGMMENPLFVPRGNGVADDAAKTETLRRADPVGPSAVNSSSTTTTTAAAATISTSMATSSYEGFSEYVPGTVTYEVLGSHQEYVASGAAAGGVYRIPLEDPESTSYEIPQPISYYVAPHYVVPTAEDDNGYHVLPSLRNEPESGHYSLPPPLHDYAVPVAYAPFMLTSPASPEGEDTYS